MKNSLIKFHPFILIEILDNDSANEINIHTFLNNIGYKKYFIDDEGNISEQNINAERRNYFYQFIK